MTIREWTNPDELPSVELTIRCSSVQHSFLLQWEHSPFCCALIKWIKLKWIHFVTSFFSANLPFSMTNWSNESNAFLSSKSLLVKWIYCNHEFNGYFYARLFVRVNSNIKNYLVQLCIAVLLILPHLKRSHHFQPTI